MVDLQPPQSPPNPNHMVPPSTQPPSPAADGLPSATKKKPFPFLLQNRPKIRVTSEFDSDSSAFFHKISCKLFDNLAKLKLSFNNNAKREISEPQLSFTSKYLSVIYDVEEQNAFIRSSLDVGPSLQFSAAHDVKAQQGELAVIAKLADPGYAVQLSSVVPSAGLPKASFKFPCGEISLEEKEEDEEKKILSISGIAKGQFLDGLCTAQYRDEDLKLRYCYKDEALSFIPSISLPSNALSFAFKRRFTPSDKLSYWYNFDSNYWSAVYKHTYGKDYKFKAGYDSEVRLGWASLWVGDENGKAKTAPLKTKIQFMLQVPQDDVKAAALMFRVKKRWDI